MVINLMHIVHGLTLADMTVEDLEQLRRQLTQELELIEEELCLRKV
jgi:hypothetical protein